MMRGRAAVAQCAERRTDPDLPAPSPVPPVTVRLLIFMDGTKNNYYNVKRREDVAKEKSQAKTTSSILPPFAESASSNADEAGLAMANLLGTSDKLVQSASPQFSLLTSPATAVGTGADVGISIRGASRRAYRLSLLNEVSYQNDYSNVARLFQSIEQRPDSGAHVVAETIYGEGPGSTRDEEDSLLGYAFGAGTSGIINRVDTVVDEVTKAALGALRGRNETEPITLKVAIFGFSRGAAAARHLVWKLQTSGAMSPSLNERFQQRDRLLSDVVVDFLGLFDTVSSHEESLWGMLNPNFADDVDDLHLDQMARVSRIVHLMAADEYRENFAVTTAQSAKLTSRLTEVYLPGAHSDIGGSYPDHYKETQLKVFTLSGGNPTAKTIERAQAEWEWFAQRGWCHPALPPHAKSSKTGRGSDVTCDHPTHSTGAGVMELKGDELFLTRCVRNTYSFITLRIMARFATEVGLSFRDTLQTKYVLDPGLLDMQVDGVSLEDYLWNKAQSDGLPPVEKGVHPPWLRKLRGEYFHMSAEYKTSLDAFRPQYCRGVKDWGATGDYIKLGTRRRHPYPG